jgi:hypothetical protein
VSSNPRDAAGLPWTMMPAVLVGPGGKVAAPAPSRARATSALIATRRKRFFMDVLLVCCRTNYHDMIPRTQQRYTITCLASCDLLPGCCHTTQTPYPRLLELAHPWRRRGSCEGTYHTISIDTGQARHPISPDCPARPGDRRTARHRPTGLTGYRHMADECERADAERSGKFRRRPLQRGQCL